MSTGINKVILIGNVGKEPESRRAGEYIVASFPVATTDRKDNTEWHQVEVWNKLADICCKYLQKGKQVYVEGRIKTDKWQDSEGNNRYKTKIVGMTVQFLGSLNSDNTESTKMEDDNLPF
jgi:single-strand DNA-binding protein